MVPALAGKPGVLLSPKMMSLPLPPVILSAPGVRVPPVNRNTSPAMVTPVLECTVIVSLPAISVPPVML